MKYKMYCIFAKESLDKLNGVRGKLATQAGHAYLHAFWDATAHDASYLENVQAIEYMKSDHAYKITLVVDTVEELLELEKEYEGKCGTSLVTDAGFTVFKEPTTTCLGLGPISEEIIGESLKRLKTLT